MKRAPRPDLDHALAYIVSRFDHPRDDGPSELDPVSHTLRAEAARRAAAMRAAAEALRATHDEGWTATDAYHHTPNGSYAATIGARYRWRATDADPAGLLAVVDALEGMARTVEGFTAKPAGRRGRQPDDVLRLLVREVAIVCGAHGVAFTDHPTGEAAAILRDVFGRVRWAPNRMSPDGLRRHLRAGRAVQRRGGTSILAWPDADDSRP